MRHYLRSFLLLFLLLKTALSFGQADTSAAGRLESYILSVSEEIENNPSRQSNYFNPSDSTSLPIGIIKEIGGTKYIICIDSARYTPQGAFFSAYMALDFPGTTRKIAFRAANVQFNPKGVIGGTGARLYMVSEQRLNLGPNIQMVFKGDGYNFIDWDCNGYHQAGLSIDFEFNPDLLINAQDSTQTVKASFRTVVDDLHDISLVIPSITPFKVRGADDFVFELTNVILDRSEKSNPQGIVLPPQTLNQYGANLALWKGFYAQNITVRLPEKLSPQGQNTTIYAHNLILDDAGVSGTFGGTNILDIGSGSMSGWGFSISSMAVQLTCNQLTGGSLAGEIRVPIMDNQEFDYSASITSNYLTNRTDYLFTIQPTDTASIHIPCLSSSIIMYPTSVFEVRTYGNSFVPKAILNGIWTFDHTKGKIKGISYQNFTIVSTSPFITSGLFSLVGNGNTTHKLYNFPLQLSSFGFANTSDNHLKIFAQIGMNLGDSPNSFSITTGLHIVTKNGNDPNGRPGLNFDRIGVDNIGIDLNTNAFKLTGVIAIRNDDPTFGDLFYGAIQFRINAIMQNDVNVAVGFGKLPDYKYWFVEVGVPVNIQVTSSIKLTKLFGGIQHHVQSTEPEAVIMQRVLSGVPNTFNTANPIPFVPNQTYGLSFRAGVAFQNTLREDLLNGEAMFSIAFNSSGGLLSVNFNGSAFLMVKREDRMNANAKKVYGIVSVNYDNANHVFDAQLNGGIVVPSVLTGNVNVTLHVDENDWYFWINRPSNRAYVSVINLFTINAYFMIGTQIDPIPPPPSDVTSILGTSSFNTIDVNALSTGDGFATGVQFTTGFNKEIHLFDNWYGYAAASCGAGFDMSMFRVTETAHCVGSTEHIGVNRWYCMGQVYGYVSAGLGVRKIKDGEIKNEITLIGIETAFLLQGRLPKPTYASGQLGILFHFLTFNFGVNVQVSVGNDCQIVYN